MFFGWGLALGPGTADPRQAAVDYHRRAWPDFRVQGRFRWPAERVVGVHTLTSLERFTLRRTGTPIFDVDVIEGGHAPVFHEPRDATPHPRDATPHRRPAPHVICSVSAVARFGGSRFRRQSSAPCYAFGRARRQSDFDEEDANRIAVL